MKMIQETIHTLEQYGFQDCTQAASTHDNVPYLCAFERPGEEKGVRYCCATEDDLFALLSLVEAAASPEGEGASMRDTRPLGAQ